MQKAKYLFKKSKVGKNEECTVTVKTATDQLKKLHSFDLKESPGMSRANVYCGNKLFTLVF